MIRALADDFVFFLIPFLVFGFYLLATRRRVTSLDTWREPAPWLVLAGLLICTAVLIVGGLTAPRSRAGYVPPHMENGALVPGRFQ